MRLMTVCGTGPLRAAPCWCRSPPRSARRRACCRTCIFTAVLPALLQCAEGQQALCADRAPAPTTSPSSPGHALAGSVGALPAAAAVRRVASRGVEPGHGREGVCRVKSDIQCPQDDFHVLMVHQVSWVAPHGADKRCREAGKQWCAGTCRQGRAGRAQAAGGGAACTRTVGLGSGCGHDAGRAAPHLGGARQGQSNH